MPDWLTAPLSWPGAVLEYSWFDGNTTTFDLLIALLGLATGGLVAGRTMAIARLRVERRELLHDTVIPRVGSLPMMRDHCEAWVEATREADRLVRLLPWFDRVGWQRLKASLPYVGVYGFELRKIVSVEDLTGDALTKAYDHDIAVNAMSAYDGGTYAADEDEFRNLANRWHRLQEGEDLDKKYYFAGGTTLSNRRETDFVSYLSLFLRPGWLWRRWVSRSLARVRLLRWWLRVGVGRAVQRVKLRVKRDTPIKE